MGPPGHAALEVTLRCIGASFYIIFEAEGMVRFWALAVGFRFRGFGFRVTSDVMKWWQ